MAPEEEDDYERAAAGQDFDDPVREKFSSLGAKMAEHGPGALFEEIENLIPEAWREQIQGFPIAALTLGFGIGLFLGMKKGQQLLTAGTSMITAAALANVNRVMQRTSA